MATEAAGKRAFEVLRPLCVQVMKAPTLEAARALDNALVSLPSMHPALMEYVTLPLRLILRQGPRQVVLRVARDPTAQKIIETGRCSAGLTECTLQCLSHVIRLVDVLQNWELFHELLSYACMMLDDKMRAEAGNHYRRVRGRAHSHSLTFCAHICTCHTHVHVTHMYTPIYI